MRRRRSERPKPRQPDPEAEIEFRRLLAEARERDADRKKALQELGFDLSRLEKAWKIAKKGKVYPSEDAFLDDLVKWGKRPAGGD